MWHKGSKKSSRSSKVCLLVLVVTVYNNSQSVDVPLLYSTTRLTEVGNEEMKGKEEKKRQGKRENHWKEGDQCRQIGSDLWQRQQPPSVHIVSPRKTMDIDRTEHTQTQTQRVKRKERVILLLVDSSIFEREKWNLGDLESHSKTKSTVFLKCTCTEFNCVDIGTLTSQSVLLMSFRLSLNTLSLGLREGREKRKSCCYC